VGWLGKKLWVWVLYNNSRDSVILKGAGCELSWLSGHCGSRAGVIWFNSRRLKELQRRWAVNLAVSRQVGQSWLLYCSTGITQKPQRRRMMFVVAQRDLFSGLVANCCILRATESKTPLSGWRLHPVDAELLTVTVDDLGSLPLGHGAPADTVEQFHGHHSIENDSLSANIQWRLCRVNVTWSQHWVPNTEVK